MNMRHAFGRTIQLFLVDGSSNGLIIATMHGWTGSLLVCKQSTFDKILLRPELDRTGIYILYGADPDNPLKMKAYIGKADSVRTRISTSARNHSFWETAVAITTSDHSLTKGHVRYLEARLWELATEAGRVTLANTQQPGAEKRHLPEADKANMEAFLANLITILPVVGLELLKPQRSRRMQNEVSATNQAEIDNNQEVRFEVRHKSGVRATAVEEEGEFVVLEGSEALKNTGYVQLSYSELKSDLIRQGVLEDRGDRYVFTTSFPFRSPSAAAAIVLDRNSNGRIEWKVVGSKITYHDWQSSALNHAETEG